MEESPGLQFLGFQRNPIMTSPGFYHATTSISSLEGKKLEPCKKLFKRDLWRNWIHV